MPQGDDEGFLDQYGRLREQIAKYSHEEQRQFYAGVGGAFMRVGIGVIDLLYKIKRGKTAGEITKSDIIERCIETLGVKCDHMYTRFRDIPYIDFLIYIRDNNCRMAEPNPDCGYEIEFECVIKGHLFNVFVDRELIDGIDYGDWSLARVTLRRPLPGRK
ncbi:hypothetical protein [Methylocystis heyeri]|uniref:Uncharacterized protein n=1 Tax=Methylocystis heyeri TaxID=391905 RepID=A0A6B8KMH9_9HYPH|nr:hypothetical protein [Methylocystis heyeri]QGM48260.1 hypothetical protein H2LOC_020965 [Methylocystis heyeri]